MTGHPTRPQLAEIQEACESASWSAATPAISAVVPTHNRAPFLPGLIASLAAQRDIAFEAIIVDDGSTDDTWQLLVEQCATAATPLKAIRLASNDGPAIPRNTGAAAARSPLIAYVDDDCLPTPAWLAEMAAAFDGETVIVQGRTTPEPGQSAGAWGRSLTVAGPTGLFEAANLGVRRDALFAAGGFPPGRFVSGRPFGEDALLGSAVARLGASRFHPGALVHHRVLPGTYADFLREQVRLSGFPALLSQIPELDDRRVLGVFFSKRRAAIDVALLGMAAGAATAAGLRSPFPLVAGVAALPWVGYSWRDAGARGRLTRPLRTVQLMVGDVVGFAALVTGSVRSRHLLL